MTGYDLTEAVEAGVQALRAAGLADTDGDGYVLENVYAAGAAHVALTAALPHLEKQIREDCLQRLARAAYATDSKHHLSGTTCTCGFEGDARKRTQTEHITAALIEEYDHD